MATVMKKIQCCICGESYKGYENTLIYGCKDCSKDIDTYDVVDESDEMDVRARRASYKANIDLKPTKSDKVMVYS